MKRALLIAAAAIGIAALAWALWPESVDGVVATPDAANKPARTLAEQLDDAEREAGISDAGVGSLSGVVRDENGAPVGGAVVHAMSIDGHALSAATCGVCGEGIMECTDVHTAYDVIEVLKSGRGASKVIAATTSAADGTFRFDAVPQQSLTLIAEKGTRTGRIAWEPGDEQGVGVDITENAEVRLKVVTEGGPVVGVRVTAVSLDSFRMIEGITDGSGQLRLEGLDEGRGLWVLLEGPAHLAPLLTTLYSDQEETELLMSAKRALLVRTLLGGKPTETRVTVKPTSGHPLVQETTGGSARFDGLSADYSVDVTAMNETLVAPVRSVTLEKELTVLDLELKAAARLLVTVVDEAGNPVASADVIASDPTGDDFHNDIAMEGAMVVLGPMGGGMVVVDVNSPGLRPWHREVELHPGDNPLEVVLKKGVRLRGTVLGPDDKPASQAQVEVHGEGPAQPLVFADDDGTFELTFDEPGTQEISATLLSAGRATTKVQVPNETAIIRLEARAQLDVFVHEGKTPVRGVAVTVIAMGFEAPDALGVSEEDGHVKMSGFDSGNYRLAVQHADFRQIDNIDAVLTDGRVTRLDVELDRGLSVDGVVVDASGAPVEGADISTVPWTSSGVSDEQGRFTLTTLDPGLSYEVVAATTLATSKPKKFKGAQALLRLVLVAKPMVTGRVVDAKTGEALMQFSVDSTLIESADGRFSVPVDAVDDGSTSAIEIVADGYQTFDWQGALGAGTDIGTVRLEQAKTVDGIVRDITGRPISGAIVTCDSSGDEVTTAFDGTFRIEITHVVPEMTLIAKRGAQVGRAPVRMTGLNEILLEPGTRVTGQVIDANGRGVSGPVSMREVDGVDEIEVDAGSDGNFISELSPGRWVFVTRAAPSGQTFTIAGATQRVVLGVPPGSCSASVQTATVPDELVLVPGDSVIAGDVPSQRLLAVEGAVQFDTASRLMRVVGFKCGVYTLIARWSGMQRSMRVDVSAGTPAELQLATPPELAAQAGLH